jgi:hypothetical protein
MVGLRPGPAPAMTAAGTGTTVGFLLGSLRTSQ